MADHETWAKRVADWKASGLSSPAFCEGKDFTPGGLRHMAHRLGVGRQTTRPSVRLARVVPVQKASTSAVVLAAARTAPPVVVELGPARLVVGMGVDRETLTTVIEVLAATAARTAR